VYLTIEGRYKWDFFRICTFHLALDGINEPRRRDSIRVQCYQYPAIVGFQWAAIARFLFKDGLGGRLELYPKALTKERLAPAGEEEA